MTNDADLIVPGGALQGPLFARLLARIQHVQRELAAGERVGPYRIVAPLGRGGSAFVYLAERADGEFEQRVALKVVGTGGDAAGSHELLKRERQILASLAHPHIARLLDGGSTPDGWLWFAMEPVQGERIDRHCRSRGLARAARLRLFGQVCDAVQFAHARLLVHRDLKPSNILVTDAGEVRLLDFGIATLLQQRHAGEGDSVAFTPGYASPEQRRGEAVTTASDIWQLGRLLSDLCEDAGDAELHAIVARAMHEDPGQRYGTVAALAGDVDNLLRRRPVQAYGGGVRYRLRRFASRHRFVVWAASVATAAFLGLAAFSAIRIAAERDQALREAARANAAAEFLRESLFVADPSESRGDRFTVNEMLERSAGRLATELQEQPELRASLLETIGRVHMGLGQLARAEPLLAEAVAVTRAIPDADAAILAQRLRRLAQAQWRIDRFDAALAAVTEGFALVADRADQVDLQASLLITRSACEVRLGRFAQGAATARQVLALVEHAPGAPNAVVAYAYNNLAHALLSQDEIADAVPLHAKALATISERYGPDHPDTVSIGVQYARALTLASRLDEAAPVLAQAKDGMAALYGTSHRYYGDALEVEAQILHQGGRSADALPLAQRAVELNPMAPGHSATERAQALQVLAQVEEALGDRGSAAAHWREAVELRDATVADGHPDLVRARLALAALLCRAGNATDGRMELAKAMAPATGAPPLPMIAAAQRAAQADCRDPAATAAADSRSSP